MDIRYAVHPEQMKTLDTKKMREQFLVKNLFVKDRLNMAYSHIDRIIAGGVCPVNETVELKGIKELGVDFFLQRREMGIINIGAAGVVSVDGKAYPLGKKECLYIGMGTKEVSFASADRKDPAMFYFNSTPAHAAYPVVKLSLNDAQRLDLGDPLKANVRTIYQFIHPKVLKSCQLVMGLTILAPGSNWNTMPCHTHDRPLFRYAGRYRGFSPDGGAAGDAAYRCPERTGRHLAKLVHPFGGRDRQLHLHLGDGR
jgi:4-deoxy-L-threo-5-hexosulose-uronate ketol-isomerase